MSRPLQIRDVPDDVLDALKAKARQEHLSLTAYPLGVLERDARLGVIADVLTPPHKQPAITRKQILKALRADRAGQ